MFELRTVPLEISSCRAQVAEFLSRMELDFPALEYYAGIFEGDRLIAGGGFDGSTIKCVAADERYRGEGLISTVVSHLLSELQLNRGCKDVFLFTKPQSAAQFTALGFHEVGRCEKAVLLESSAFALGRYLEGLKKVFREGENGAVVMNCNPFTNGHRYLTEQASARCDNLYIFVVEQDSSLFPFETRYELVKKGTAGIENAQVVKSGPYIISKATFPTYFIKEKSLVAATHAELDCEIFARRIAPALNIKKRFFGSEPDDPATADYNAAMLKVLPRSGIAPIELERKKENGDFISASTVRALCAAREYGRLKALVPDSTYQFLISQKGRDLFNDERTD